VELMISTNKRLWWKEEWKHVTLVEVSARDQHATSIVCSKRGGKGIHSINGNSQAEIWNRGSQAGHFVFFGSQIVECSMESTQSSTHIPIYFVSSTHHVPSQLRQETTMV